MEEEKVTHGVYRYGENSTLCGIPFDAQDYQKTDVTMFVAFLTCVKCVYALHKKLLRNKTNG